MEWLTCIRKTIEYIEDNLHENIDINDVSKEMNISPMFLQRGFSLMTGYSIGEYIRNRRLYNAALDLYSSDYKVIDIAFKYFYETPESFTKAFTRFHGATPKEIRQRKSPITTFLPLKINICINGGLNLKYTIKSLEGFKVLGFKRDFSFEEAQALIPSFWDETFSKYAKNIMAGKEPANEYEKALRDNHIGEYGICIDNDECNKLTYLIAGKYEGGEVPEGMMLYEFSKEEWALFDCVGPLPASLQSVTNQIFKEWLPGNPDYEINGNSTVEWYDSSMNNQDANYHSQVWIPVKRKN